MKTFLVSVDFSAVTEAVVANAIGFAQAFAGKVVLLHVVQPPIIVTGEYALPVEVMQEAFNAGAATAKAKVGDVMAVLRHAGVECTEIIRHGPPVETIREVAAEVAADFIIMGSHGHGKLYDLFIGSTASGVLKKAKCGVIIIPPADKHA